MDQIPQEKLLACEQRAIELYYQAPPEKLAGDCQAELVAEFGEDCVRQMLKIGIGCNHVPAVESVQDSAIIPTTVVVDFNINECVMVKLTQRGREILEAQHRELMGDIPVTSGWEYLPPREDEDGWSKWQAWHLMSTFGQHVFLGCEAPFETEIRIVLPASILNTPL